MKMNFDRDEILGALKKNRENHLAIVLESQEGFREKLIKEFERKLADLKAGKAVKPKSKYHLPQSNVDDYDRAIMMLDMCKDETIELDESTFQAYVRDKWNWQGSFLHSNMAYSGLANEAVENDD